MGQTVYKQWVERVKMMAPLVAAGLTVGNPPLM